jgi:hypothetical protein
MNMYFKMRGEQVIPCSGEEACEQFENFAQRNIVRTLFECNCMLSTVFLVIKHFPADLFETMYFPCDKHKYIGQIQWRYETLRQSKHGHQKLLEDLAQKNDLVISKHQLDTSSLL